MLRQGKVVWIALSAVGSVTMRYPLSCRLFRVGLEGDSLGDTTQPTAQRRFSGLIYRREQHKWRVEITGGNWRHGREFERRPASFVCPQREDTEHCLRTAMLASPYGKGERETSKPQCEGHWTERGEWRGRTRLEHGATNAVFQAHPVRIMALKE